MESAREAWQERDGEACLQLVQQITGSEAPNTQVHGNLAAAHLLADSQAYKSYTASEIQDIISRASHAVNEDGHTAPDRMAQSVLLILNTAAALSNANQIHAAAKLLAPVWQTIEKNTLSISEEITLGVCFLLIDLDFASKNFSQVAATLSWLERKYELGLDDKEESDGRVSALDNASSVSGDFSQQASPGSTQTVENAQKVIGGYNIQQLWLNWRARLQLVSGDVKAAKKTIRSLLALDITNPQAISLKAELEASRGNLRRAGKLISNRPAEAEPLQGLEEVQTLCNMAFIQHQEGRHHTAVLCYSNALKLASQRKAALIPLIGGEDIKASAANITHPEVAILYSCGVQALLMKQHNSAHECFQKCTPSMFQDPVLWIRMAECCMGAYLADQPLASLKGLESEETEFHGANEKTASGLNTVLLHGKQCAANASYLFTLQLSREDEEPQPQKANGVVGYLEEALNAPPLQKTVEGWEQESSKAGKCNALCISAFFCLQLGHAASALQLALDLLEVAKRGTREWQLAQAYASEALYLLGKPVEAVEHLQSALEAIIEASGWDEKTQEDERAADGDDAKDGQQALAMQTIHSFKVAVLVNLASTYFAAGDVIQASEFAQEGAADDESRDAIIANAYMQLCSGDISDAMGQLKAFQLGVTIRN